MENNIPYQEVELTTKDGIKLAAWYTPPAKWISDIGRAWI